MVAAGRRVRAGFAALLALATLVACGGGDNDGTRVERSTVAVRGVVDDGLPASPIAGARCEARPVGGAVTASDTADDSGAYLLLVEPGQQVEVQCAPPDQDNLLLRRLVSTEGQAEGSTLDGQELTPATTVVSRLALQEAADTAGGSPSARFSQLLQALDDDADLRLLAAAATEVFNTALGGADWDFEALWLDVVEDGTLDIEAFDEVAEALAAAIADLEQDAGRTLRAAYLDRFPDFDLSLLHHAGARSALFGADDGFGGAARFAATVAKARDAAAGRATLLVSAGDQLAPVRELVPSLDDSNRFFDAAWLAELDHDALALGVLDLALGPPVLIDFLDALPGTLSMIASTVDVSNETQLAQLGQTGRLRGNHVVEVAGRRIGVVTALRSDADQQTSVRSISVAASDQLVEAVQTQVNQLQQQGARIVVLLSQQADLAADRSLAEALTGVSVVVSGAGALLANDDDRLVPGDEQAVAGDYPQWLTDADTVDVPLVSTGDQLRYLGQLTLAFDPLGQRLSVDGLNSGSTRVAGAGVSDGVMPDPEVEAILEPLQAALDGLADEPAAESDVLLDASQSALRSGETNFGNLLADAVFAVARGQSQSYGAAQANVAVINAAAVTDDAQLQAGTISRAQVLELLDPGPLLSVVPGVSVAEFKELLESALADDSGAAFLQLSGVELDWDPDARARELDAEGEVVHPGARVRHLRVAGGNALIEDGEVVAENVTINLATSDRIARGENGLAVVGGEPVLVGQNLPLALDRYLRDALEDARVTAADYPPDGEGRIQVVN